MLYLVRYVKDDIKHAEVFECCKDFEYEDLDCFVWDHVDNGYSVSICAFDDEK